MARCDICGNEIKSDVTYGQHVRDMHSISCDEVKNLFAEYSRGHLKETDDERIICHLAACKECSDAYAEFGKQKIHGGALTMEKGG